MSPSAVRLLFNHLILFVFLLFVLLYRTKDVAKDLKQDMALRTTSDPGKKEEAVPPPEP